MADTQVTRVVIMAVIQDIRAAVMMEALPVVAVEVLAADAVEDAGVLNDAQTMVTAKF